MASNDIYRDLYHLFSNGSSRSLLGAFRIKALLRQRRAPCFRPDRVPFSADRPYMKINVARKETAP